MSALLVSVLASSVVGSLHCGAMCGPLQALYLDPAKPWLSRWRLPLTHAAGRLGAYLMLGAAAGVVGAALDLAGRLANLQRIAMVAAGATLIVWGVATLASALGVPLPRFRPRAWNHAVIQLRRRRPTVRAALLGLLSGALPCGWLWAFVVVAAGTGSLLGGLAVMTSFWLGTLPMMLGLGAMAGPLIQRFGARLPLVTAAGLVAAGVIALSARLPLLRATGDDSSTIPACHQVSP